MFLCEKCSKLYKKGEEQNIWSIAFTKSEGRCEVCNSTSICMQIASSLIQIKPIITLKGD